jgi:hypothetical protein
VIDLKDHWESSPLARWIETQRRRRRLAAELRESGLFAQNEEGQALARWHDDGGPSGSTERIDVRAVGYSGKRTHRR